MEKKRKNLQKVKESRWRLLGLIGIKTLALLLLTLPLIGFGLLRRFQSRFLVAVTAEPRQPFSGLTCSSPQNHSPTKIVQPNTFFKITKQTQKQTQKKKITPL